MIIATAGHVDHGKTSLVKALTGVDTDRLAEEQRRGMTIELGFAYVDWASGEGALGDAAAPREPIGFVDVPGHERLVRTMLAGVAGIDLGLLVVAADDGPMPQTREHLDILTLLAVPQLVVALSKVDRVTPQRLVQARLEVTALLADGPYAQAPLFAVAATAQVGVAELRRHLTAAAHSLADGSISAGPTRTGQPSAGQITGQITGHFRMAIDRSFTLAGAGRIVTGTVLSGQVQVGDEVLLSPAGTPARVRGLHAQNVEALQARAGQRCALNLAGTELKRAEPQRGDWVLAPPAHAPSVRLDVQLQVLGSAAMPLSQRAPLQLHLGAAVVNARVAALAGHALSPGSAGLAQLVLDRPVAAAHGDRFVLRDAPANRSLAGGWVIDPFGPVRGRSQPKRLMQLAALAQADPAHALAALLTQERNGVDLHRFALARNLRPDEAERLCDSLCANLGADLGAGSYAQQALHRVDCAGLALALAPTHWQAWRADLLAALDQWHTDHPDSLGAQPADLKKALGLPAHSSAAPAHVGIAAASAWPVVQAVLAALVDEGQVARDGLRHRRATHRPRLSEADTALLSRITALLQPAGLRPPIVGDLAAQLGMPLAELPGHLARLAAQGQLVRVAPNRFYLPETVTQLIAHARALAAERPDGSLDAAAYRDRTGIGRNLTVQVLEFFNREGLTRFDGQRHQLLP